ncbi:helix-turn-helix domain-containing protein [Yinghuangia sp. ASG 101]|uniref:helix-turn-helix transcriptional regulator n=1 Tax=Yinghuangia sp. ASG 101 TaxID=2896848 RepID=UPI001E57E344|nr:helix-turn-helix transcriptional regulator [Yinghuangia sp. ASG 101]UGQ10902.1 helix-turn-helix domain-containing protein [Yinghuangia sp. ASG 101]
MSNSDWPAEFTAAVGQRVRRERRARGMTAADLAGACARLGVEVPSRTITNWETGKRATVGFTDLLVIAKALGVSPISLLFPLGHDDGVEVLPGRTVPTWDAVAWFTDEEIAEHTPPPGSARTVLNAYRNHAAAVHTALTSLRVREERRRQAGANPQHADAMLSDDLDALHALRTAMRADRLEPPPIPARLTTAWDERRDETATGDDADRPISHA